MLGIAILAYAGAPLYVASIGACLLTLTTMYEYMALRPRLARFGAGAVASTMLGTAALSLAFASLCFAVGRTFAWITVG